MDFVALPLVTALAEVFSGRSHHSFSLLCVLFVPLFPRLLPSKVFPSLISLFHLVSQLKSWRAFTLGRRSDGGARTRELIFTQSSRAQVPAIFYFGRCATFAFCFHTESGSCTGGRCNNSVLC